MARWVALALALSCTDGLVARTAGWSAWDGGSGFKTQAPPQKTPLEEYEESVRKGDSLCAVGNYFDAVLAYERAWRIAYNNKLKTDSAALDDRLAKARKARDQGEEGEVARFLELTVPQATSVRVVKSSDYRPRGGILFDGVTDEDRWQVTNAYLPGDRRFFSMIYGAACSTDGTLYVATNAVVPAEETRRRPRSNLDWYADNGHGLWRVATDGRVTAFSVGPYGTYPPPALAAKPKAFCDVGVAEAAFHSPDRWGGIAVAPNGDVYVSDYQFDMILRLRSDGYIEHIAGGGEKACAYEPWKDKKESGYRDGTGRQALFKYPRGLAFDHEGNLLVADRGNCSLRRIDASGNVTTLHKFSVNVQRGCQVTPDDVGKPEKWINFEYVAIDPQNRPVVGGSLVWPSRDIYSNIHRLHPDGRVEQLLSARKGYANTGQLRVEYLSGLAFLPDGRFLIADDGNNLLRAGDGKGLTDWLGAANQERETDVDGRPPKARVRRPGGVCVTGDGTVFIAPAAPRAGPVRKVDGKTREMTTWVY